MSTPEFPNSDDEHKGLRAAFAVPLIDATDRLLRGAAAVRRNADAGAFDSADDLDLRYAMVANHPSIQIAEQELRAALDTAISAIAHLDTAFDNYYAARGFAESESTKRLMETRQARETLTPEAITGLE